MAELAFADRKIWRENSRYGNSENFKERKSSEDRRTLKDVHASVTILIIMSS